MNDVGQTLLEMVDYIIRQHPQLASFVTAAAEQARNAEQVDRPVAKTVLEIFNHLLKQNPEFAPMLEETAAATQGKNADDVDFLLAMPREHAIHLLPLLRKTPSQIKQDLFVLSEMGFKKNGYFVEFGASGGFKGSNTWLLENEYAWNGIVAEPSRQFHEELKSTRRVNIETRCVWRELGKVLTFNEVSLENLGGLSTIESFSASDNHSELRKHGVLYDVESISLLDLLAEFNAPKEIDYLSIDTEGSELDILSEFDFDKYRISIITCEHNYTPNREKIHAFLVGKGYARKYEQLSKMDDWFVKVG